MKIIFIPYSGNSNPYQKLLSEALCKHGVEIKEGKTYRFLSILRNLKTYWKPSILHIHWSHPFLVGNNWYKSVIKSLIFTMELIFVKLIGIKIVWTVHNLKSHECKYLRLELFFNSLLAHLSIRVITHCKIAKKNVEEEFKIRNEQKVVTIPHGNYLNCYVNDISKGETGTLLNISPDGKVFLFLGQIRPYKGVLNLIKSFKRLKSRRVKLIVAGKPYNDKVANRIRIEASDNENIKLIFKFVKDNEIQLYMNASDVVVFPYENILTSGGIMLAMSFAKAIIAPKIGCIPETLDSLGSFLYDPNNNDGLLESMKIALRDDVDLKKMGHHNLKLAKKLDWSNIAKKTYDIYKKIIL